MFFLKILPCHYLMRRINIKKLYISDIETHMSNIEDFLFVSLLILVGFDGAFPMSSVQRKQTKAYANAGETVRPCFKFSRVCFE